MWSHGPGVRGHCQTAVCLYFPILLRPQAGVVRRRMYSRAGALSAKKYFWKMLDGKSSSTVKRDSSAASAVEYSFHLGFIIIFLIHFPKGCKIQSPLLIAVRSANKRKTRAKLSLQQLISWPGFPAQTFTFTCYIYALSRRFYPKRLTIAFRLYIFFFSTCVPWESNPQPFALLTQCSTTEPHRNTCWINYGYWAQCISPRTCKRT